MTIGTEPGFLRGSVLDQMAEERIFAIYPTEGGKFQFVEQCDECFRIELSSEQLTQLANELLAFADG